VLLVSPWHAQTAASSVLSELELSRADPKESDLCLGKTKPFERKVEVYNDADVQIARQTWIKGRKTNRTFW